MSNDWNVRGTGDKDAKWRERQQEERLKRLAGSTNEPVHAVELEYNDVASSPMPLPREESPTIALEFTGGECTNIGWYKDPPPPVTTPEQAEIRAVAAVQQLMSAIRN